MEIANEINLSISGLQDVNELNGELIPLSLDEQDAIVGGFLPLLIPAAFAVARFAPAVIRAAPAVIGGVQKYRDSSIHKTEGKWWSFL